MKDNTKEKLTSSQVNLQKTQIQQKEKLLQPFKNRTLFQQIKHYYYNLVYHSSPIVFKMIHDRYYNKQKYQQINSLMKEGDANNKLIIQNRQKIKAECKINVDHDSLYSSIPPLQQNSPNHQNDQHRLIFQKYIRDYQRVSMRSSFARIDALLISLILLGSYIYKFKAKAVLVSLWIPGFYSLAKNFQSLFKDIQPAQSKIKELMQNEVKAYQLFYQVKEEGNK